jgi:hypothetical protein
MVTRKAAVRSVWALFHHPHGHLHRIRSHICTLAHLQGEEQLIESLRIVGSSDAIPLPIAFALHQFYQDRHCHATYHLSILCFSGEPITYPSLVRNSTPSHSCPKSVGVNSTMTSSILVGLASQFWLRRYHPGWYRKYNYILGGALDGGAQVMIFILSFAVFGASGVSRPFPTVSCQVLPTCD